MKLELEGRNAIVTGGTSGIGLSVAKRFLEEGVNVVINGRDASRLEQALAELRTVKCGRVLGLAGDVSKPDDIRKLHDLAVAELGGVDILFNNAGTGSEETIAEATDERWQHFWDLHVMAAVRLSRLCVRSMEQRGGGVIINNASVCALQPIGYEPVYNVTKAALVMLGKCMANEFIARGVRVNNLNPGLIMTPNWEVYARRQTAAGSGDWQAYLDDIARRDAPIGRFGTAGEIADFVVFLASPRAGYCVGASFYVDGGYIKTVV